MFVYYTLHSCQVEEEHITQTCLCNILQYFMAVKMVIFQMKVFAQNVDCGYTLEPPH